MIIYCDYADTKKANVVSKQLNEVGIGWKNIRNIFSELICYRIVIVPKTKRETILKRFPQIK